MPMGQEQGQDEQSILAKIMQMLTGAGPSTELAPRTVESVTERFPGQADTILAAEATPEEIGTDPGANVTDLARTTTPPGSRAQQLQMALTDAAGDKIKVQQIHDEATQLMSNASPEDRKKLQQVVIIAQRALRQ